jgi:hypothetical protein
MHAGACVVQKNGVNFLGGTTLARAKSTPANTVDTNKIHQ